MKHVTSGAAIGLLLALAAPAAAQDEPRCRVLCAPELKIEPTWTIENTWSRPRIEADGVVERAARDTVFELIFAVDIPTAIPRIGLTLEAIFVPFGTTDVHPFTGVCGDIRDNGIEIESELNIQLFDEDQTGGWVSSHFDIVDKLSPGETPDAGSVHTHKLNFEWDTAFHVFNTLPEGNCGTSRWSSRWTTWRPDCPGREMSWPESGSSTARARGRCRSSSSCRWRR